MQLGPAFMVYPGATHTRAAHSFGVYHLARRLIKTLADRGADQWITPTGVLSFLAAALLHDLGHFPYAHSLKELPLEPHEQLTGKIILREPTRSLVGKTGADPELTAAIVDTAIPHSDRTELPFYRKLLSGVLDPDKLDYLNRDARYCGVPYGAQDVDFTFSRLHPDRLRGTDIDAKGIPNVEAVLFSKYLMYRSVYWHRSVRSATAMMKKALIYGFKDGILAPEELYGLDDQGLFALLADRSSTFFDLASMVKHGSIFSAALEFPFNRMVHTFLEDIQSRTLIEEDLAGRLTKATGRQLGPKDIIIDVPEPITFETGLYVSDENTTFSKSTTVFGPETISAFVSALRIIRIFVSPKAEQALESSPAALSILRNAAKWLD
jgi:HD superfamily phosphohydrolase